MARTFKGLSVILIALMLGMMNVGAATAEPYFSNCTDTPLTNASVPECLALVSLYNSTGGAAWTNSSGWLSAQNVDDWYGITVNSGYVYGISLDNNHLVGNIPSSINGLTQLRELDLYHNQLDGTIPTEISALTNLLYLNLSWNLLDNPIPDSISSLTGLQILDLSTNQFSGAFPEFLLSMTGLRTLKLGHNNFNGEIPDGINNLTMLEYLNLSECSFTGPIPSSLSEITSLKYLYLNENQFSGSIPPELFSLPNIKELLLQDNKLTGLIPTIMADATTLQRFFVNDNYLTGTLPTDIGDLQNLQILYIHGNDLYGPIPASFINLSSLNSLIIGNNGFWSTDSTITTFIENKHNHWEEQQSSQGVYPLQDQKVGWGDLDDAPGFSGRVKFSKYFNNAGTEASKYMVGIYNEAGDLIYELEELPTSSVCSETGADVASICTYSLDLSKFTLPLAPGVYQWGVRTWDGFHFNDQDTNQFFTIATPPGVIYPTNQTTRVNPTFKWGTSEGAEGYNLWVMDNLSNPVLDQYVDLSHCDAVFCIFAPTTSQLTLADGSYNWMVRADMGDGDYTDWGSATFPKVAAPTTKQPSVVNTMPNPKIIWTPVAGQTRYQVQLYTSGGVKKLDKTFDTSVCGATTCTYAPTTAILNLANGAYKWKVRAGDAVEWGTYSAFKTFNKVSPPAGVSPTGTITATNPTFKWKKITGVIKYYLELRKSSGVLVKAVTIISPSCTSTTCSYTFAPALDLAKGDYKWHVKAYHGYYGPYGAYLTFKKQ
jgi:Leucine-rich repeat (LRR) protein